MKTNKTNKQWRRRRRQRRRLLRPEGLGRGSSRLKVIPRSFFAFALDME